MLLLLGTLITSAALLSSSIPLGVVGEWQWSRHELISNGVAVIDRLMFPLLGAGVLFAIAVFAQPAAGNKFKSGTSYVLLLIGSWVWINCVQQSAPPAHREIKPYWILYDPSSAGYFYEAAFKIDSTPDFLANYEARMQEGEVLHVGTHPPGLFLLSKGCLSLCESSPTLVSSLNSIESDKTRKAFRVIEAEANFAPRLKESQIAALHLLKACSTAAVVLTILPLYLLASQWFDSSTTWKLCCLWPTLPCLAVFLPKSDVLFPLTCTTSLALTVIAMNGGWRMLWAIPAGIVLWLGLMLSLAHLPVIVVLVAFVALRAWPSKLATLRGDAIVGGLVLFSIIACCLFWNQQTNCNIFNVWKLNLTNHEGFYTQYQRTWWKWLIVNPLELLFASAAPVMLLAGSGVVESLKKLRRSDAKVTPDDSRTNFALATLSVVVMLWLSGKNQGEAARLWCFLMPWVLLMAGNTLQQPHLQKIWKPILIMQLATAIVTVGSVSGFSF